MVYFTNFKLLTLRDRHSHLLFDEKFAQPCVFAVVNCTECVLLLCFNRLPDIFAVMNCSVSEDR